MWVTQTYLHGPRTKFPLYLYALFNPYTNWHGEEVRRVNAVLARFGRQTAERAAAFMPGAEVDADRIGEQLDRKFSQLVHGQLSRKNIYLGLWVLDMPLEDVNDDGRNARWAFFRFDSSLQLLGEKVDLERFMAEAEHVALESDDPVQELVLRLRKFTPQLSKLLDDVSINAVGLPAVKPVAFFRALKAKPYFETNIYE